MGYYSIKDFIAESLDSVMFDWSENPVETNQTKRWNIRNLHSVDKRISQYLSDSCC